MYNAVVNIATQNLDVTCNNDWANEKNDDDEDYGNATGNDGSKSPIFLPAIQIHRFETSHSSHVFHSQQHDISQLTC